MSSFHLSRFAVLASLLIALLLANTASAALLLYEPFDYTGTDIDGQSSSTEQGLSGTWSGNVTVPESGTSGGFGTQGTMSIDDTASLSHPGVAGTPVGGRLADSDAGTAERSLDGFSIDMNGTNTYYVSGLFKGISNYVQFEGTSGGADYVRTVFGTTTEGGFILGQRNNPSNYVTGTTYDGGSKTFDPDTTYLLTMKIVCGANDQYSLKIFDPTMWIDATEPVAWDYTDTDQSGVNLTRLFIGRLSDSGEVDELRVGTQWSDVITPSVPEPGTAMLLLIGSVAGTALLRRRYRV